MPCSRAIGPHTAICSRRNVLNLAEQSDRCLVYCIRSSRLAHRAQGHHREADGDELKIQLALNRRKVDRIDRDAFEVTSGCTRVTADTMKACAPVLPTLQAWVVARHRDDLTVTPPDHDYVLLDKMSDADIAFNVARLRN